MKNWLAQHGRVVLSTLSRLLNAPLSSLLNILVIGCALSLPAGMYTLLQNAQGVTERVVSTPQVSVFLAMDAGKSDIARIGKLLRQHEAVDQVEFVPRDSALEQLKQTTGLTDVIGGLTQNPLPDAYVIQPKRHDTQTLERLRDELRQWPKVDLVQLDSAWARKLEALLKFGRMAVLLLTLLLGFALVAVTFNTIRLQILTRRDEIEVAKLIGATNAFIRRPFLYFGLMQGLLGGIAAWLIVTLSVHLVNGSLLDIAQLYSSSFSLQALAAEDGVSMLLFSAALGWLGAWLSVAQHLRRATSM